MKKSTTIIPIFLRSHMLYGVEISCGGKGLTTLITLPNLIQEYIKSFNKIFRKALVIGASTAPWRPAAWCSKVLFGLYQRNRFGLIHFHYFYCTLQLLNNFSIICKEYYSKLISIINNYMYFRKIIKQIKVKLNNENIFKNKTNWPIPSLYTNLV